MRIALFGHSVRHAALMALQVVLAGILVTVLLLLAERHNVRFDLTPTQSFVLSDEAHRVAQGLHVPVRVTVFYNGQDHGQRRQMDDLLQLFGDASRMISYRMLDLDRSPALAKKYGISSFNTGVMESEGQLHELRSVDEEEIANGLLKLTRRKQRVLCFVTGHGEHSPEDAAERSGYSQVAKALEKENFQIKALTTLPADGVPAACTVVLLPGPTHSFLPEEADQLSRYLDGGGRVLLMIDPNAPESVVQFLARFNIRAGNDIIVDERNRLYGADSFMPRVPIFDESTFHKNLDTAAVFALARSLSPIEDTESKRLKVLLIALTSPESWARIDDGTVPEGTVRFRREKDRPGPVPVGIMVTDSAEGDAGAKGDTESAPPTVASGAGKIGRMIVFGDSDFASNLYLNLLGNKDLFMSSVGVLAEDEELIAIRRKGLPNSSLSPVFLTAWQGRFIFWIAVVAEPAIFAVLGLLITWRRRRRGSV
ncbi:MAG: GldG family protein [Candidatus Binatia bacterium]